MPLALLYELGAKAKGVFKENSGIGQIKRMKKVSISAWRQK
jgi:hypothetical protein